MGQSSKDLVVWQKSMLLAKAIYVYCESLPKSEQYGLTSQMQRSAVSIASNLAEGSKRKTTKDFKQFIAIAKGSAAELETQLMLTADIFNLDSQSELNLLGDIQRMLEKLWQSL